MKHKTATRGARRTPLFEGTVKPAHRGVYRRQLRSVFLRLGTDTHWAYSYWTGRRWMLDAATPAEAYIRAFGSGGSRRLRGYASDWQRSPWQGLSEQPGDCLACAA